MKLTQKEIKRANDQGFVIIVRPWKSTERMKIFVNPVLSSAPMQGTATHKISLVKIDKLTMTGETVDEYYVADKANVANAVHDLMRWQSKMGNNDPYFAASRERHYCNSKGKQHVS